LSVVCALRRAWSVVCKLRIRETEMAKTSSVKANGRFVDKSVALAVPEGAQRFDDVRRAVAGLRELQQRIRRRSKAKLSNRGVRSAIDEGR
jgi:hypothetical protein